MNTELERYKNQDAATNFTELWRDHHYACVLMKNAQHAMRPEWLSESDREEIKEYYLGQIEDSDERELAEYVLSQKLLCNDCERAQIAKSFAKSASRCRKLGNNDHAMKYDNFAKYKLMKPKERWEAICYDYPELAELILHHQLEGENNGFDQFSYADRLVISRRINRELEDCDPARWIVDTGLHALQVLRNTLDDYDESDEEVEAVAENMFQAYMEHKED